MERNDCLSDLLSARVSGTSDPFIVFGRDTERITKTLLVESLSRFLITSLKWHLKDNKRKEDRESRILFGGRKLWRQWMKDLETLINDFNCHYHCQSFFQFCWQREREREEHGKQRDHNFCVYLGWKSCLSDKQFFHQFKVNRRKRFSSVFATKKNTTSISFLQVFHFGCCCFIWTLFMWLTLLFILLGYTLKTLEVEWKERQECVLNHIKRSHTKPTTHPTPAHFTGNTPTTTIEGKLLRNIQRKLKTLYLPKHIIQKPFPAVDSHNLLLLSWERERWWRGCLLKDVFWRKERILTWCYLFSLLWSHHQMASSESMNEGVDS